MRFEPDARLRASVGVWLPDVRPGELVDELTLLLAVAAAVDDERAGRLGFEQGVVLDAVLPGWRDEFVRHCAGFDA